MELAERLLWVVLSVPSSELSPLNQTVVELSERGLRGSANSVGHLRAQAATQGHASLPDSLPLTIQPASQAAIQSVIQQVSWSVKESVNKPV
jgi:hypothetical protein